MDLRQANARLLAANAPDVAMTSWFTIARRRIDHRRGDGYGVGPARDQRLRHADHSEVMPSVIEVAIIVVTVGDGRLRRVTARRFPTLERTADADGGETSNRR